MFNYCLSVLLLVCTMTGAGEVVFAELPELAMQLVLKQDTAEGWQKYVKKQRSYFEDWSASRGSASMDSFLNDNLKDYAYVMRKKAKPEQVKKVVYWLALYKEFGHTAPEFVRPLYDDEKGLLIEVATDFSWEKVAAIINRKIDERNKEVDKGK